MLRIFHDERVKFVFGGGFNTLFSIVVFSLSNFRFNELISLTVSFWLTYFVSYFVYSYIFQQKNRFLKFSIGVFIAYIFQQFVGLMALLGGADGILVFLIVSFFHVPFYYILLKRFAFK